MMKIAIISDLHVGNGTRAKDFCPIENPNALDDNYKERFLNFILENNVTADYLIIPGDISNQAQNIEFNLANEIINEIAEFLEVTQDKVLFVPGNHDVDWSILKGYSPSEVEYRRKDRYIPLMRQPLIFNKIMSNGIKSLINPPYYSVWDFDNCTVVGYNSSHHDDPNISVHHGMFQSEAIDEIENTLKTIDSSGKIKIFIVHHHPVYYHNPVPLPEDHSLLTNSDQLLNMLHKNKFDLLIHGHKHTPGFKTIKQNSGYPLVVLCSGSFSSLLDTRWSGIINNQFHLVEISGRDSETKNINGFLKSWTFVSHLGWIPSLTNNGIPHIMPFGADIQPEKVKNQIKEFIQNEFKRKSHVKWRQLYTVNQKYEYIPRETVLLILEELKNDLSFEIHETNNDLILLKADRDEKSKL